MIYFGQNFKPMKQRLIYLLLEFLSTTTGKFFLYITKSANNKQGKTAVEDVSGVWHVGNVFDKDDAAYGIAQNGVVEEAETQLVHLILNKIYKNGPLVFFDIGANIGYYGLLAGTIYKAEVHSFEPTPVYADNIRAAAKLNDISELLTVHNYALSNSTGEATFMQSGSGSSLEVGFNKSDRLPTITVKTESLDTAQKQQSLPLPSFMKIDVEGHEWAVLEGSKATITEAKPVIFVELCTTLRNIGRSYTNPHYVQTIQLLTDADYVIYYLKPDRQLEVWNHSKTIDQAGMFLCLHKTNHLEVIQEIKNTYTIIT